MVRMRSLNVAVLFVIADLALGKVVNETINVDNKLEANETKLPINLETRRKEKKHRETSSSSGDLPDKGDPGESLDMSDESTTSEEGVVKKKSKNKYAPVSSAERPGWRKWHRKCVRCPEEMDMKWRDPSIDWICGAYQDARRSFKSACMMRYRNCQDGTMFVKIHDHRCADDAARGDHFFYDYVVKLSGESSKTQDSSYAEPSQDIDY